MAPWQAGWWGPCTRLIGACFWPERCVPTGILLGAVIPLAAPTSPPRQITREDLEAAEAAVGEFGGDNRAGVQGTLHRISAIRNRRGTVVGLTCRVGRAVTGHIDMIRDILEGEGGCL